MYEYYDHQNESEKPVTGEPVRMQNETSAAKDEKKEARRNFWIKLGSSMAFGLGFGVVAAMAFVGINHVMNRYFPQQQKESEVVSEAVENEDTAAATKRTEEPSESAEPKKEESKPADSVAKTDREAPKVATLETGMDVSDVAKLAMPSIVSITNKSVQEVRSMFGRGVQEYESESAGSGIIIGKTDEILLIVTNNHVVEHAKSLSVSFIDEEVAPATIKGTDADCDLAVIFVNLTDIPEATLDAIRVAQLGKSDALEVGEQVVAIGNALGYGQSVTTGIVSAMNREVTIDNITNKLIQTDAAINPGNSGGALLNMNAEVIGINSAKFASASVEGMGYAIPISSVNDIIDELVNREIREKVAEKEAGYLGITGISVDSSVSEMYGIPEGVYLSEITEGSPAEKAGLVKTDVIKKFDGVSVSSIAELKEQVACYKAGEKVDVLIYRLEEGEYKEMTVPVTLGSREGTVLDPAKSKADDDDESDEAEDDLDDGINPGDGEESNPDTIPYSDDDFYDFMDPFNFFNFGY